MSPGEIVGIAIAMVALLFSVWALGRVSSYDGWIRRVERQWKEADARQTKRMAELEDSMRNLGDSIAKRVEEHLASPAVSKKLAENVGVFVVSEVGSALAEVKGSETLRSIGMRLTELRLLKG